MDRDATPQQISSENWRLELLGFLAFFFGSVTVDAVSELHEIGRPITGLLLRALIVAAIFAGALYAMRGKGKRAG